MGKNGILRPSANGGMSLKGHTLTIWKQRDVVCRENGRSEKWPKPGVLSQRDVYMRNFSDSRKIGFFVDIASDFV